MLLGESDDLETPLRESLGSGAVVLLALDLGIFLLLIRKKRAHFAINFLCKKRQIIF